MTEPGSSDAVLPPERGRLPGQTWWYDARACRAAGWMTTAGDPCQTLARLLDLSESPTGVVLKTDQRSVVTRVNAAGGSWVVKRYLMSAPKTLLYNAVRMTPTWREWRGARYLASLGTRVAIPVAMGLRRRGLMWDQVLILPWVEGRTLHKMLVNWGPADQWTITDRRQREAMARQVGHQVGKLAAAGVVNRDYKPSNLMVDAQCLAGGDPVMIDLVGLRRRRGGSAPLVQRMLETFRRSMPRIAPITNRERAICLRAAWNADPSLFTKRVPKRGPSSG